MSENRYEQNDILSNFGPELFSSSSMSFSISMNQHTDNTAKTGALDNTAGKSIAMESDKLSDFNDRSTKISIINVTTGPMKK
eukprot:15366094-Ditylum_brightwellii.AAC.1